MKKTLSVLLSLLMIVTVCTALPVSAFALPAEYTVSFVDSEDESHIYIEGPITAGEVIGEFEYNVTKENREFTGWYTTAACNTLFDFENTQIQNDTKIYAGWKNAVTYNISFDSNGAADIETKIVVDGKKVAEPEKPTKEGCEFVSWCTDPGLSNPYDFNSEVHSSFTLYAKWLVVNVSLELTPKTIDFGTFESQLSENIYKDVTVKNTGNTAVTLYVAIPEKDGPFSVSSFDPTTVIKPGETFDVTLFANTLSPFSTLIGGYSGNYIFTANEVNGGMTVSAQLTAKILIKAPPKPHVHTLKLIPAKPATYTATGSRAYYYCDGCKKYFKDAQAKTETTPAKEVLPKLPKKANTITVKVKKVTLKAKTLKKKKLSVATNKAFAVTNARGKVTYAKVSGNKKISISSSGKVTVKKGLKKGKYTVKVKVSAAGNTTFKPASKTVKLKITVK